MNEFERIMLESSILSATTIKEREQYVRQLYKKINYLTKYNELNYNNLNYNILRVILLAFSVFTNSTKRILPIMIRNNLNSHIENYICSRIDSYSKEAYNIYGEQLLKLRNKYRTELIFILEYNTIVSELHLPPYHSELLINLCFIMQEMPLPNIIKVHHNSKGIAEATVRQTKNKNSEKLAGLSSSTIAYMSIKVLLGKNKCPILDMAQPDNYTENIDTTTDPENIQYGINYLEAHLTVYKSIQQKVRNAK